VKGMKGKKIGGFFLYFLGIGLGIVMPPVERLACMMVSSGEVCTGINILLLTIELSLMMLGALLISLSHFFKSSHHFSGFLGVSTGLGIALIGGYAGLNALALFGVALATLGLILYKAGG